MLHVWNGDVVLPNGTVFIHITNGALPLFGEGEADMQGCSKTFIGCHFWLVTLAIEYDGGSDENGDGGNSKDIMAVMVNLVKKKNRSRSRNGG